MVDSSASLKPADLQAASDIYQQILNVNVLGPTLVTRAATNLIDHTIVSSLVSAETRINYFLGWKYHKYQLWTRTRPSFKP